MTVLHLFGAVPARIYRGSQNGLRRVSLSHKALVPHVLYDTLDNPRLYLTSPEMRHYLFGCWDNFSIWLGKVSMMSLFRL